MRVKKVPLQDLELWPDEVICFSAYTDTRNPVQQRRTYVDGAALEAENEKLRELSKYAILCSEGADRCLDCPYHDKTAEPHIICTMRTAAAELGIEAPE